MVDIALRPLPRAASRYWRGELFDVLHDCFALAKREPLSCVAASDPLLGTMEYLVLRAPDRFSRLAALWLALQELPEKSITPKGKLRSFAAARVAAKLSELGDVLTEQEERDLVIRMGKLIFDQERPLLLNAARVVDVLIESGAVARKQEVKL